jgi:hypothetical protein
MKGDKTKPVTHSWILFNVEIVKFSSFYTGNVGREVSPCDAYGACDACVLMNMKDTAPLPKPDSDVQRVYS